MKGVSPLIGFVITVFLSFVAATLAIKVIMPTLNRAKAYSVTNEAIQNLKLLDSAIQEVASESPGSKRTIELKVSDGIYKIDKNSETIYFDYTPDANIPIMGKTGNLWIEKGLVFSEWFGSDNSLSDWNQISGNWQITNGELEGGNGAIYHEVGKTINDFYLCGFVQNKNGKGEIYLSPVNPTNLVEFLSFDEGSGPTAYDYSGHQNNGILKDGNTTNDDGDTPPKWVDGVYGKALQFDGVDDYVDCGNDDSLQGMRTVVAFFYAQPQSYYFATIVGKAVWTGSNIQGWVMRYEGNKFSFVVGDDTRTSRVSVYDLTDGMHLAAGVIDNNTNKIKLYIDGELIGTAPLYYSEADTKVTIGWGYKLNFGDSYYNGTIDEVRIYNRALSDEEIKALYEIGKKKIESINCTNKISASFSPYVVISNPYGTSYFDNIRIERRGEKNIKIVLPYSNVEFYSNNRIPKGVQMVSIENIGYNDTTDKPIIKVSIE